MDVSVDIVNDTKIRKLFRHAPAHAPAAFMAYVATMAESWRSGRRVNIDDAWPPVLPFSQAAVEALIYVRLLDESGRIITTTWRRWHEPARKRRTEARARWARYNEKRPRPNGESDGSTTPLPRGNDVDTATSVPPVRSVRPSEGDSPPTPAKRGLRANGTNPRSVAARGRESRKRQINEINLRYYRGELTEADRDREIAAVSR